MSLLHPSRKGSLVFLWFVGGDPVRLVHGTQRFRVIGKPEAIVTDDARDAWRLTVRDDRGYGSSFVVNATADGGWEMQDVL